MAWISDRVSVGRGDEGGQAAQGVERLEHETGDALRMRPGPAQMIEDAAIVTQGQAFLGEGGPQSIAAWSFQPSAVTGRDGLLQGGGGLFKQGRTGPGAVQTTSPDRAPYSL